MNSTSNPPFALRNNVNFFHLWMNLPLTEKSRQKAAQHICQNEKNNKKTVSGESNDFLDSSIWTIDFSVAWIKGVSEIRNGSSKPQKKMRNRSRTLAVGRLWTTKNVNCCFKLSRRAELNELRKWQFFSLSDFRILNAVVWDLDCWIFDSSFMKKWHWKSRCTSALTFYENCNWGNKTENHVFGTNFYKKLSLDSWFRNLAVI